MNSKILTNKIIKPAKSRSVVPIPDTVETVKGYPDKLVIFKVPASEFWWTRYHDGKPIKRSTKTENKAEAIRFAKNFYETLLVNKRQGVSSNPKKTTFTICAQGLMKEDDQRVIRDEISAKYAASQKSAINSHILKFFSNYEFARIDYALLDVFKKSLFDEELAPGSVKIYFVALKRIFEFAVRNKHLQVVPFFPKVKTEDNPRAYLPIQQYKHLRRTTRKIVGTTTKIVQVLDDDAQSVRALRNVVITEEIKLLIPFMVYTFIRPSDLKSIKHKHIEIRKDTDAEHPREYLWMPIPKSKRHKSPITSMPNAAYPYKLLRQRAQKALTVQQVEDGVTIDDQYVFMPQHLNREYAYQQIYRQFEVLLDQSGLKNTQDGGVRAMYSLRHTAIMYRLLYGGEINSTKIAKNARTSTEMLERFYLSQLESQDFTRDLHRPKKARQKKPTSLVMKHAAPPLTVVFQATPSPVSLDFKESKSTAGFVTAKSDGELVLNKPIKS